ncbi:MAG TPA: hypothetical protein VLX92_24865 [Kofleriaceae bacterium]|nr:hypothetical protein [Kofleriaceae bacterium]
MRRFSYCLVIASLGNAAPGHADTSSLHFTATGSVAATDNVFGAPDNGDREADVFTDLKPGVLFAYDTPRIIQELSAAVDLLEYVAHSDQPSVTAYGGWKALILSGPRSQVLVGADGGTGELNAIVTRTGADQTTVVVTPTAATQPISLRQADGSEGLSWQSGKQSRLAQNAFVSWAATDDNAKMPTTTDAIQTGMSGTLEGDLHGDAVALTAGATYLRLERIAPGPPGTLMGSDLDREINPNANLTWRHDINKKWSFDATGGVIYVDPVGTDPYAPTAVRRSSWNPTFGGVLAYIDVWGRATFAAAHSVAPNLLMAENAVDTNAIAQVSLPLPWLDNTTSRSPKLVGSGTLGFDHSQLLDAATGANDATFDVVRLDASVAYTPRMGETFAVRYQLLYQRPEGSGSMAALLAPTYYSNTLFFTFSYMYPDRIREARVPLRSEAVRADRSDLVPGGDEPVVPDAAEQQPDAEDSSGDQR